MGTRKALVPAQHSFQGSALDRTAPQAPPAEPLFFIQHPNLKRDPPCPAPATDSAKTTIPTS